MNKIKYIIIGIIITGLVLFLLNKKMSKLDSNDFFISTSSESSDRIEKIGLTKSEDFSHILDENLLNIPQTEDRNKNEYKADSNREWILNLKLPTGEIIKQEKLSDLFDLEWRKKFPSTIYGHSPEDNKWTYTLAGGAPKTYDEIQIGISFLDVFDEEKPDYNSKKLERYITELKSKFKKNALKLKIQEVESKSSAIEKSKKLIQLKRLYDKDFLIILQSQNEYSGIEVWDVLQSLGLIWGDGDLFHWNNSSTYGSEQHFSVWTSTEPGYFLPEQIKEGKMNPSNLIFGFSIPRSADPINVNEVMVKAIKYCQKRLGGKIINIDEKPFDEQFEKKELKELVKSMIDKKIIPGSDTALMLY